MHRNFLLGEFLVQAIAAQQVTVAIRQAQQFEIELELLRAADRAGDDVGGRVLFGAGSRQNALLD